MSNILLAHSVYLLDTITACEQAQTLQEQQASSNSSRHRRSSSNRLAGADTVLNAGADAEFNSKLVAATTSAAAGKYAHQQKTNSISSYGVQAT